MKTEQQSFSHQKVQPWNGEKINATRNKLNHHSRHEKLSSISWRSLSQHTQLPRPSGLMLVRWQPWGLLHKARPTGGRSTGPDRYNLPLPIPSIKPTPVMGSLMSKWWVRILHLKKERKKERPMVKQKRNK